LTSTLWETADSSQRDSLRQLYEMTDQAKYDFERQQFNTVVSTCMKILNLLNKLTPVLPSPSSQQNGYHTILYHGCSILLRLLAPITPHITHQLWQELQYPGIILKAPWPKACPINFRVDTVEMVIQVNGKLRTRLHLPTNANQQTLEESVKQDCRVQQATAGKVIKKIIVVPGKLINIVTEIS
jgi:leucyl-tRNA synthetase